MRCRSPLIDSLCATGWRAQSRAAAVTLFLGFMQVPADAAPAQPLATACDGERVQVTLGLPIDYPLPSLSSESKGQYPTLTCISVAQGNPYELLSWLEKGSLRAAVLPEFAVAVLRSDDPAKFASDYVEFEVSPVTLLHLVARTVRLIDGQGRPVGPKELADWFTNLSAAEDASATVVLPHHLSVAVRELFAHASRWADERQLSPELRERFMGRLVAGIRFQLQPAQGADSLNFVETLNANGKTMAAGALDLVTRDRLLVRRQLLANLQRQLGQNIFDAPVADKVADTALFAKSSVEEARMGDAVRLFRAANYLRQTEGSIARRYFRFSIPELWAVFALRDAQDAEIDSAHSGLALVLTGGGVKAAYQTRLVDALYSQEGYSQEGYSQEGAGPRLRNGARDMDMPGAQRVDYVIGTSGGALLGMFVGALNDSLLSGERWPGLTSLLWRPGGGELKSWNVFPLLDMLRYFSVLVCFWTLWIVMMISLRWFGDHWLSHVRVGSPQHAAIETQKKAHSIVRWKSESWAWILLLGSAPMVVVYICNRQGLEHVPPVAGIYYTLMAVIAWYADVGLTAKRRLTWREVRLPKTFVALAVIGVSCIAVPASGAWVVERCEPTPWQVNLCFLGFLLLAFALLAFFAHQRDHFDREPVKHAGRMLGGILVMVAASYAVLWVGVLLGQAAFLELTGGFWLWLLPAMLACSVLLVTIGRVAPDEAPQSMPQRAVGYMFGEHNSRAFWTGHRRYTRWVVIATLSWCWWNVWVAPGLYGNCPASEYFQSTYAAFAEAATQRTAPDFPLATPYVVTATSLEKGQERYFLFVRDSDRDALDDRAWFNIASDGRWITVREYQGKDLRAAAFASGSPFPVFSSHQVELSALGHNEHLIDGGFAHNKPLDAARALGARKVLVLNSSPLESVVANGECAAATWLKLGELACKLPKLLPYLWSRSQVEDSLSSANMLVASIYPVGDGETWPMLTDFRGVVVERMIAAAERDLQARIGTVESWGAPRLTTAYLLPISPATIERAMHQ